MQISVKFAHEITFIFAAMFAYAIEMQKICFNKKILDRQSEQGRNKVDHN